MNIKRCVLSGIRPTAGLHLGNVLGAVANMAKLQEVEEYNCFFLADYHAGTTRPRFQEDRRHHNRGTGRYDCLRFES
ncbi:MAG: hypothetical protein JRG74_10920 [Deltaproteobacteria bacterium]|nr:hypothetical protein [Deltaproteobacteria bacterium]